MRVTTAACNGSLAAETLTHVPHMQTALLYYPIYCFAAVLGAPSPTDSTNGGTLDHENKVYTCVVSPLVEEFHFIYPPLHFITVRCLLRGADREQDEDSAKE